MHAAALCEELKRNAPDKKQKWRPHFCFCMFLEIYRIAGGAFHGFTVAAPPAASQPAAKAMRSREKRASSAMSQASESKNSLNRTSNVSDIVMFTSFL